MKKMKLVVSREQIGNLLNYENLTVFQLKQTYSCRNTLTVLCSIHVCLHAHVHV